MYESDIMISKKTAYTAKCDRCPVCHPGLGPKSLLKTALKMDGWKVTGDHVLCPHCAAMEEEE